MKTRLRRSILIVVLCLLLNAGVPGCVGSSVGDRGTPRENDATPLLSGRAVCVAEVRNLSGRPLRRFPKTWYTGDSLELSSTLFHDAALDFPALLKVALESVLLESGYALATPDAADLSVYAAVTAWDGDDLLRAGELHVAASAVLADGKSREPILRGTYDRRVVVLPDQAASPGMPILGEGRMIEGRHETLAWRMAAALLRDMGLPSILSEQPLAVRGQS